MSLIPATAITITGPPASEPDPLKQRQLVTVAHDGRLAAL
jgi:hypothetical protein